jgi:hypothetical protein
MCVYIAVKVEGEAIFSLKKSFHPQESIFSVLEVILPLRMHALISPPQLSQLPPDILHHHNHRILDFR